MNRPTRADRRTTRSTTAAVDEAIAYLYTHGLTTPTLAKALGLTERVVTYRVERDNLLSFRHAYQRQAFERCADDLRESGIDVDAALVRLDAAHIAILNTRTKEDE